MLKVTLVLFIIMLTGASVVCEGKHVEKKEECAITMALIVTDLQTVHSGGLWTTVSLREKS